MWLVEMICIIWKVAWNIWTFHCDYVYSPDSLWETRVKQDLQTKIRHEYNKGPDGATGQDRWWWKQGLQKILNKNPHHQELWLLSVETVRNKIDRKRNVLANQRHILWTWLHKDQIDKKISKY